MGSSIIDHGYITGDAYSIRETLAETIRELHYMDEISVKASYEAFSYEYGSEKGIRKVMTKEIYPGEGECSICFFVEDELEGENDEYVVSIWLEGEEFIFFVKMERVRGIGGGYLADVEWHALNQ